MFSREVGLLRARIFVVCYVYVQLRTCISIYIKIEAWIAFCWEWKKTPSPSPQGTRKPPGPNHSDLRSTAECSSCTGHGPNVTTGSTGCSHWCNWVPHLKWPETRDCSRCSMTDNVNPDSTSTEILP